MFEVGKKYQLKKTIIIRECMYVGSTIVVLKDTKHNTEHTHHPSDFYAHKWHEYKEPMIHKGRLGVLKMNDSGEIFFDHVFTSDDQYRNIYRKDKFATLLDIIDIEYTEKS